MSKLYRGYLDGVLPYARVFEFVTQDNETLVWGYIEQRIDPFLLRDLCISKTLIDITCEHSSQHQLLIGFEEVSTCTE